MKVDYAFLAESAEQVNGKLYVLGGGIDSFWSDKEPFVYPRLSFVLRIVFEVSEIGRDHKIEIQLMDEDGRNVHTVGANLNIPKKNPNLPKGWQQAIGTVINFANLQLPKFGNYSFNILINNSCLHTIPIRLAQRVKIQNQ